MPDWFDDVVQEAKARQRELNAEREGQGQSLTFGRMVIQSSDRRPGGAA